MGTRALLIGDPGVLSSHLGRACAKLHVSIHCRRCLSSDARGEDLVARLMHLAARVRHQNYQT